MKIGIDCRLYSTNFTGIGRYVHELVNHFIRLNDEDKRTHEIVLFFNNPEYQSFQIPNSAVKKVLVNAKHYSLKEQAKFLKILNKENCDIVHFPHFNVPIFYNKPYVVTIHDLTLSIFPGQKMTRWYHRLAYNWTIKNAVNKSKNIIAVSENTKKDIVKYLNINEDKIRVIYNGISEKFRLIEDPSFLQKTLNKYNIKDQFLLYTGVWRNHKNLPRLLEAFKIIKEKGLNLKLVITGKEDPHYPEVRQTVKSLKLENEVIFPGLVTEEELINLYNSALFYVFPSLYEGFGLPPLESMKCGTPVLASNVSSIPEICGKENALFFNPEDSGDIAEKIYSLYKDADLQAELITGGYIRAGQFSWSGTAKQTYKLICSSLSKTS